MIHTNQARNMCFPQRGAESRRQFLRFITASPLLARAAVAASPQNSPSQGGDFITSPEQAINIMDFEPAARRVVPPAHFGFLTTGVDDDSTVRANRDGFTKFAIRARRLVNVEKLDTSITLFGTIWKTPIFLSPVSSLKAFHAQGDIAIAKAARAKSSLQILSTYATSSVEDVTAARNTPVWLQLYATDDWNITRAIVKRAEAASCPALVFTIDNHGNTNRETFFRSRRRDKRDCTVCHESGFAGSVRRIPMFDGLDVSKATGVYSANLTWDFAKRLKDSTGMKLLLKGIVIGEDAQLAVEYGADGIVVSNHGGRTEDTLRSTIECLPEVVAAVKGKIPVLIDGGVRRGTDVFKALALGASAVGIGRPYVWGLAAFGQPGVETVLDILRREVEIIMRQAGTPSIGSITRAFILAPSH